jgi:hypothetical protein
MILGRYPLGIMRKIGEKKKKKGWGGPSFFQKKIKTLPNKHWSHKVSSNTTFIGIGIEFGVHM